MRVRIHRADDGELLHDDVDLAWWLRQTAPGATATPEQLAEVYERELEQSAIEVEFMTAGKFYICQKGRACPHCGAPT